MCFRLLFILLCLQSVLMGAVSLHQNNQGPASSKALRTARLAEIELQKASKEGFLAAINILEPLAIDPSFRKQQPDIRIIGISKKGLSPRRKPRPRAPDRDATASVRPATGLAQAQADPNRTLAGRFRRSFLGSVGSIVFGMEADSIVLHDRAT